MPGEGSASRSGPIGPLVVAAMVAVGALAAGLTLLGNPGNMGICGACFARDLAGALRLFESGPKIFRPEILGIVLGALVLAIARRRRFVARSGSHAAARFVLGIWMGIGALVFLGCPFRLLQRLGGGDLNALVGAAGLLFGVGVALFFERRGYHVGKTAEAAGPVGWLGPVLLILLFAIWGRGGWLEGPTPGSSSLPAHAPWAAALGIAFLAGMALQWTGFCAISACRQVFFGPRRMLVLLGAFVLAYAAVVIIAGRFSASFEGQPAAHQDHLWSALSMALVGLCGAFAGGCPVRQMVMTGEGNGDAFVTLSGIVLGGALSHSLGIVSGGTGATPHGRAAVIAGLAFVLLYGALVQRAHRRAAA